MSMLAAERLARWRLDPAAMVREEFHVEPQDWQLEALHAYATHNRLAMKACKGPGKTTVLAWIILNFLGTRGGVDTATHPKIGATSITGDNLDTCLWPEIAKWQGRSEFFTREFVWTSTRVFQRHNRKTWFAVARTWPKKANAEEQANALAGIHGDSCLFVLDESGGIPQSVMATAEAVLSTGGDTKVVQSGNPTHTTGPLYRACNQDRADWYVVTITGDPDNPKRSPRIDLKWARQQIKSYGRDNPWVMVNVLGEFPPASINALLGVEEVERAMARHLPKDAYEWAQKRLGVDVARFGDDRTVIFPRQGLASFRPVIMRNERTTAIAARVAKGFIAWKAELILIDDTGHWGHGAVDALITAGYPVVPIIASDKAIDKRYKNRRCEMWLEMAKWVKAGGALPKVDEMVAELTEPTYTFLGGVFVLEDKDQLKERLGHSPDLADGLAQTFALPDQPGQLMETLRGTAKVKHDFDPYALDPNGGRDTDDFNPFDYPR